MSERSKLGELIKAQPRKTYEFPVDAFAALGGEVHKVAIRVATKKEQDVALKSARAYVARMLERGEKPEDADEFFEDAKSAAIVAACCLDPEQGMLPVWPNVDVVSEDLTPDRIAVLVRMVNEVRAKDGPVPIDLDDARVESFATMAAVGACTDVPDTLLTPLSHPYLVHLYVLTALKLQEARAELARLAAKPEEPETADV
jgi:hypothetical protein